MIKGASLLRFAGTSALAIAAMATSAYAQDGLDASSPNAGTAAQAANAGAVESGEIIVTARRKDESLQDVPLTVTAVTSETVEKLNLTTVEDLSKVVAGLQLQGGGGFQSIATTRGVTYSVQTGASPTVATYINEAPVSTNMLFQGIFDVGQFEVLKGTQGTLRGISAPSGSITLTTRRPDLDEINGTFVGSITNHHAYNAQAAVNLPIIDGVLGVRVAGLFDQDEGGGIRSANSSLDPYEWTKAYRISTRFDPSDTLSINLMYQRLSRKTRTFGGPFFGPGGTGGGSTADDAYRPALTQDQRLGVADGLTHLTTEVKLFTGQLDWRFWGQKLSYVGSWQALDLYTKPDSETDTVNYLPNQSLYSGAWFSGQTIKTHEVRLASDERIAGIFDYIVGFFYRSETPLVINPLGPSVASGALGPPGTLDPTRAVNYRYTTYTDVFTTYDKIEKSIFFNIAAHPTDRLEVSFGGRFINASIDRVFQIGSSASYSPTATPSASCLANPLTLTGSAATYPGFTDCYVAPRTFVNFADASNSKPFVYTASVSYKITPDLMVYFTHGTSWRQAGVNIGIQNGQNRPEINKLLSYDDETSRSYELGLKATLFNGKGRFNIAVYRQDFDNLIYFVQPGALYVQDVGFPGFPQSVGTFNFTVNAPARIWGVDVDFAFDITDNWTLSGNFSWADGKLNNAVIPCYDTDGDGVPDGGARPSVATLLANTGGSYVVTCKVNSSSTSAPKWNVNLQSEFTQPLNDRMDGFIRGLFSYQPSNPNTSAAYTVPGYALLDLFVGLRDPGRRWEASVFAKNIFDNRTVLSQGTDYLTGTTGLTSLGNGGNSGYRSFSTVAPREFGFSLRYSFGLGRSSMAPPPPPPPPPAPPPGERG